MQWISVLKQFVQSPSRCQLVYGNVESLVLGMTKRLIVLDSSFNPPHLGHFSMIQGAITRQMSNGTSSTSIGLGCINTNSVLLVFSVQNVDKPSMALDQYAQRLELVEKMATKVQNELGVACGVCLVKSPLFVDKAVEIRRIFAKKSLEIDYLLGFDTITRLFEPKYYQGGDVEGALKPFMQANTITVFLRKDGKTSIEDQKAYFDKLKKGQVKNVPSEWAAKIHTVQMEQYWDVSSSEIRAKQAAGDESWRMLAIT